MHKAVHTCCIKKEDKIQDQVRKSAVFNINIFNDFLSMKSFQNLHLKFDKIKIKNYQVLFI